MLFGTWGFALHELEVDLLFMLGEAFQRRQGASKFGNQHVNWASMGIVIVVTCLILFAETKFFWQNVKWN